MAHPHFHPIDGVGWFTIMSQNDLLVWASSCYWWETLEKPSSWKSLSRGGMLVREERKSGGSVGEGTVNTAVVWGCFCKSSTSPWREALSPLWDSENRSFVWKGAQRWELQQEIGLRQSLESGTQYWFPVLSKKRTRDHGSWRMVPHLASGCNQQKGRRHLTYKLALL